MGRYKGIAYPLRNNPTGLFHNTGDVEQIKASLLTIILTIPGERLCEPQFGTALHQLNFAQPKELIEEEARQMVANSVKRWERRIQVDQITTVLTVNRGSYDLYVEVLFIDPLDLKTVHMLTVEVPIGGNNG